MKIVVCIKQVPDTTEVRLDPKTGTLIRDGVPSIINPDDKSGLEAAIRIKEKVGGEITVLTMGPLQAENALREALAMGADRGILLTDRAFAGADTWATSQTLAAAIRKLDFDLIIAGRQAIDGDTAQVGPQIAEHLKLTQVSYVEDLKLEGDKLLVKRIFEDSFQWIRVSTPCLITTLKEMNEPRYMSVGGVFDAFREKEIIRWNLGDIEVDLANIGLKGSPTKVKKSFTKGVKAKGEIFQDLSPNEAAKLIAERLRGKFII